MVIDGAGFYEHIEVNTCLIGIHYCAVHPAGCDLCHERRQVAGSIGQRCIIFPYSHAILLACSHDDLVFFRQAGPAPTSGMDSYRSYILPVIVITVELYRHLFPNGSKFHVEQYE